jgi:hypothetical protein
LVAQPVNAIGHSIFKNVFLQKIPNTILVVIGGISFDSQDIFKYQNAIEGHF